MTAPFPSPTTKWHTKVYDTISPTLSALSASGKNILITGGGTGIGAETAHFFAQAGASHIALLGRRVQPLLDTKASIERRFPGVHVFTASTDITDKAQVDNAFTEYAASLSGTQQIDVLISNAAIMGPKESIEDVDPDAFVDGVDSNIRGTLLVAKAFLRYAAPNAVVVDVNSSAAHLNFAPQFASYSVAKLAVYRIWDSLAFAKPAMSVFHIQPGVVDTDMNKEAGGVEAMGFADEASLPAGFSLWLASPEARFLKSKYLWTNWDVDELKARAEEIEKGTMFNIGLGGWPFNDASWNAENGHGNWN